MIDRFHDANRRRWEAASASWARRADTRGIWHKCHRDPSLALHASELAWLQDVSGKSLAVLGSGDNQIVFALAGMGARVTSVDVSASQIAIARDRAATLGLNVASFAPMSSTCRLLTVQPSTWSSPGAMSRYGSPTCAASTVKPRAF